MQNVNPVNKYAIIYFSVGGNTKQIANLIVKELNILGHVYDLIALDKNSGKVSIEEYRHVFLGSPTYGEGKTPNAILEFLRFIIKENKFQLPNFSVFGSGDTQWVTFCKAVDEMYYHLSKETCVVNSLKIEQYPINKQQLEGIGQYVREVIACYN